jgi:hypothetical protein
MAQCERNQDTIGRNIVLLANDAVDPSFAKVGVEGSNPFARSNLS